MYFYSTRYRLPFDLFEEYCISMADRVVANSLYTQSVYKNSFRFISMLSRPLPHVVYPCVDYKTIRSLAQYDSSIRLKSREHPNIPSELEKCKYFISVNRYERKKEVEKAILGFSRLRANYGESIYEKERLRLVIVGGYDPRLTENVEYAEELLSLAMVDFSPNYDV